MTRLDVPLIAACLTAALASGTASAQDPGNDPAGGSPSGTVYEIPLDRGRDDAAPRGGYSPSTRRAAGSGGGSAIRSDNGFGTSSTVPGAVTEPMPAADGPTAGPSRESRDRPVRSKRSSKRRQAGGDGLDRLRAEHSAAEGRTARGTAAAGLAAGSGSPSLVRAILLLALGIAVAVALGVVARRSAHRR